VTSPVSVAVGDFNGDGKLDLAVTNTVGVNVLLGNGDGTFQPAQFFNTVSYPVSVAVGDFNGDGKPDIAVAGGNSVSVLLGNGDGTFQAAQNVFAAANLTSLAVGDFNGDGFLDFAVAFRGGVRVLLGNGDGTFQTSHVSYVAGNLPTSLAVADFNGDNWPDLAVANQLSGDVSILLNDGSWGGGAPGGGRPPGAFPPLWAPPGLLSGAGLPLGPYTAVSTVSLTGGSQPALGADAMTGAARGAVTEAKAMPSLMPYFDWGSPQATAEARWLTDGLFAEPDGSWLWDRSTTVL
jgi:hypothetical protein